MSDFSLVLIYLINRYLYLGYFFNYKIVFLLIYINTITTKGGQMTVFKIDY